MNIAGRRTIHASTTVVFDGLNDVGILRQSIPGCEKIASLSPTELTATIALKIGPITMRMSGDVTLTNLNPPHGYTISGHGSGGAAGFASGNANVMLESDGDLTILTYEVTAQLGGRLAQLGSRLIEGAAHRLSARFFDDFSALVEHSSCAAVHPDTAS